MTQGWTCRNCGEANSEGFTVCARCGAVRDLPQGVPGGKLLTKSRALDATLAAFGTFFIGAGLIFGGFTLTEGQNHAWPIFASLGLSLVLGLAAIFLLKKTHRALMLGVIIGLCLALLNPLTLCLGILGLVGAAGG